MTLFVEFRFFWLFFFFRKIFPKFCFFFSQEKITRYSLTRISGPEKKTAPEKKNSNFTHSLDFPQKSTNFNLFPGNKKIRYLCPNFKMFFRTKILCRKNRCCLLKVNSYFFSVTYTRADKIKRLFLASLLLFFC